MLEQVFLINNKDLAVFFNINKHSTNFDVSE